MAATYAVQSPLGENSASSVQQSQIAEANIKLQTATPPAYQPQGGQMILQSSGGPQAPAVFVQTQFGQVPTQQVQYQLPNQQVLQIPNQQVQYQLDNQQGANQHIPVLNGCQGPTPQVMYQTSNQPGNYQQQGIMIATNQYQPGFGMVMVQPPSGPPRGAVTPPPGVAIGLGIAGIFCGLWIFAIPAIVLGAIACAQPINEDERKNKSIMSRIGLSLGITGLVLGIVWIIVLIIVLVL